MTTYFVWMTEVHDKLTSGLMESMEPLGKEDFAAADKRSAVFQAMLQKYIQESKEFKLPEEFDNISIHWTNYLINIDKSLSHLREIWKVTYTAKKTSEKDVMYHFNQFRHYQKLALSEINARDQEISKLPMAYKQALLKEVK